MATLGKSLLLFLLVVLTLSLTIRGIPGNPSAGQLDTAKWSENGPFELSPERGRFALLFSLIEDKSFFFSVPIARFAIPDLGYKNGHYVSLFAPAISFIAAPGYLLGKLFGISQVGSYATITLFALFNFFLIRSISIRLNINTTAATLGALVFLFATPAFNYASVLYQHHVSTFLILSSLYLLLRWNTWWSLSLVWFLCAASIPIDYPNLFLMFPIGLFALGRFITIRFEKETLNFKVHLNRIFTFIGLVLPIAFFCWFNFSSYGNPLQFSGTVASVKNIDSQGKPSTPDSWSSFLPVTAKENPEKYLHPELQQKSATGFFKSRNILNGLYLHLISRDRGILHFAPVLFLGLIGAFVFGFRKEPLLPVFVGIIGANILLYSMWGDPWGGWAFGSRYLIPGYAILSIFIAATLHKFKHNLYLLITFTLLLIYSVSVNTLGAITTSANPPQIEILELEKLSGKRQLYSYDRNYEFLLQNGSKSFFYTSYAHRYLSGLQYYFLVISIPLILGIYLVGYLYLYVRD